MDMKLTWAQARDIIQMSVGHVHMQVLTTTTYVNEIQHTVEFIYQGRLHNFLLSVLFCLFLLVFMSLKIATFELLDLWS